MTRKETLAVNYSFFRFPTHYVIILLPFTVAISIFYFSGTYLNLKPEDNLLNNVIDYRYSIIDGYLQNYKIITAIILSFFLTYRWSVIEKDGKYGFWLTQGTKRHNFFLLSFGIFYLELTISAIAGLVYLFIPGGVIFNGSQFIKLVLLLIFNNLFLISFSLLISETIKNSEFALLAYGSILTGQALIFDQLPDILIQIFFTERLYLENNLFLPILISLLSTLISFSIAFMLHMKKDVEL